MRRMKQISLYTLPSQKRDDKDYQNKADDNDMANKHHKRQRKTLNLLKEHRRKLKVAKDGGD